MHTLTLIYFLFIPVHAVLFYGFSFAYWQNKYPALAEADRREDIGDSIIIGIASSFIWPVGWCLLRYQMEKFHYGFKLK